MKVPVEANGVVPATPTDVAPRSSRKITRARKGGKAEADLEEDEDEGEGGDDEEEKSAVPSGAQKGVALAFDVSKFHITDPLLESSQRS